MLHSYLNCFYGMTFKLKKETSLFVIVLFDRSLERGLWGSTDKLKGTHEGIQKAKQNNEKKQLDFKYPKLLAIHNLSTRNLSSTHGGCIFGSLTQTNDYTSMFACFNIPDSSTHRVCHPLPFRVPCTQTQPIAHLRWSVCLFPADLWCTQETSDSTLSLLQIL